MVIRLQVLVLTLAGTLMAAASPRLEYATGVLEELRGVSTARDHFEKARLADPQARPLVQRAIKERLEVNDRSGAVKLFRDLATARPDDLGIQLDYADFLRDQGGGDALALKLSADTLDAALKRYPGHPQIVRRLFQQAKARGDKDSAAKLLASLASDDPESVLLFASLSKSLYEATDTEASRERDRRFLLAINASSEDPVLARAASDHLHDANRADEAIRILENHVIASPSSLDLRVRLGVLYFEAMRNLEGEAALKEVLAIFPKHALAHQALAKFYRLNHQPTPAREHAGELLKIRGGSVAEYLKLANECLDANEAKSARLLLEKAVFQYPDRPELAIRLAIATQRDPETRGKAARLFREAESLLAATPNFPSDPDFLMESAEALILQGQSKAAEERLRSAIRAFRPEAKKPTAAALRRLAGLWESENRNAEAARSLRQRADALDR